MVLLAYPCLFCFGGQRANFEVLSWNVRTLCHTDRDLRLRKCGFLLGKSRKARAICIQEMHGDRAEMEKTLLEFSKEFRIFYNPGSNRNIGGTVILVSNAFFRKASAQVTPCSSQAVFTS